MFIGVDPGKTVVSPTPLRMSSGRALRFRSGSVTEIVPRPPSGRSRADRIRIASQVAFASVIAGALLSAVGVPWWISAAVALVLVTSLATRQARAAQPGRLATPGRPRRRSPRVEPAGDSQAYVLVAPRERAAFGQALALSRRIRRTWPALRDMIDPVDADRSLAAALHELAGVLAQRQHLRRLRAELAESAGYGLPPTSPALQALADQRERVDALWQSTRAEANRILAALHAIARAGEDFVREQRLLETARSAELALAELTRSPAATEAPELAERTSAVIAAYRELLRRSN
ncbi:hypothetical protein [Actinoplanes sp. RD1]|uniref:hypothetical protein n=1 Tax=Actinoplanes sp. RD1 TaxID=3064538 RepID=UPI0027424EDD|nr:hypothetical protein [Actinoplanes sp. RD1]